MDNKTSKSYPGIDLGRAYQYLLRLKNTDLNQRLRSSDLMHAIGYSSRGGRVSRVFGAFRQFGFAKFDGTFYTFTELGKTLLSTGSESSADKSYALQAARFSKLYESIYTRTDGSREVTLSDELVGIMVNYGIKRSDVEDVLKNYNDTLKFVDQGVTSELINSKAKLENKGFQNKVPGNAILIDFGDSLAMEVPKDLVIKAALHDLAENGPLSKVKLVSDKTVS